MGNGREENIENRKMKNNMQIKNSLIKKKSNKLYWILAIVAIVIVAYFVFRDGGLTGNVIEEIAEEETAEAEEINYMLEQQQAIIEARELYAKKRQEGMRFESQCLGTVGDKVKYVVDVIHVPRNAEDDKPENQCSDFRTKKVTHFIELDRGGNIFRIV